jgi:hypothetical protein
MHNPEAAFRDLLLCLARLNMVGRVVPEAFACTLDQDPFTSPWQVSLVVQNHPFGLRVGGVLPLHLDPDTADIEGLLRHCNDLNRRPRPATFSIDPLGMVASDHCWLPLTARRRGMPRTAALALALARETARHSDGFLTAAGCPPVAPPSVVWLRPRVDEDDIPF